MIRSGAIRLRPRTAGDRGGFTLVEILMVVIILAILVALLLPAINSAIKTAKNAAVSAEINQLASALESFKSKYGDYPPSRVYLAENGDYNTAAQTAIGPGDITYYQLAQRTALYFRKFWSKVTLNTAAGLGPVFGPSSSIWYDFNGNGTFDAPYILQGHEALVFFLGGIPAPSTLPVTPTTAFGMTGFGKDPTNPFVGLLAPNGSDRTPPIFEFNAGRLFLDPNNTTNPGIPAYYDSFNNAAPTNGTTLNFYVYFSAYGNGNYDANDVNFANESDASGAAPIWQVYQHGIATYASPSPNPYTITLTSTVSAAATPTGAATVSFQKAQTYQIFSSGLDGLYGVGGQYVPSTLSTSTAANALPPDPSGDTLSGSPPTTSTDASIRVREGDNLTNFKGGTLQ